MREGGGGVWEYLAVCVFGARVPRGVLGSKMNASAISSAGMLGLWSSEQGTTDMEMERPCALLGCSGVEGFLEPDDGLMGGKTLLPCWD